MKKIIPFLCLLTVVGVTYAQQQVSLTQFKNLNPRCIGPSGMSGRITSIDAVVDNPNIIYLGSASGGIWKTINGGTEWTPVFDEQPTQNIGAVAVFQPNPSILWAGTGEGNPRNSLNIGEGIYRSLDAGKTWKLMGLEKTRNIHRVLTHPTDPETVYVGAIGNPYAEHPERGLFKTTDGGATWNKILFTNDTSGVADMVMDPVNPNKLIVAMWQHRRTPWSLNSGGKGSGIYMTFDAGKTFKKLGKENGLPEGDYGRIGLAISRSMPNRVYALIEAKKNGLYRSNDGGEKWELVNENKEWVSNRPFYFNDIAVDPQNENRVWLIYQMIAMSEDGGKTFKIVVPYNGIHPDHHAFWINPNNSSHIIDGNDGGIGTTRDLGKTWLFDEKIPVGQFYHINVDNEMPYHVMGGMQDNGSWRGPAYTWIDGGIKNYYWESLWGGDGFDVLPDAEDANWVYAESQGGFTGRYNVKTGEYTLIKPMTTDTAVQFRFNWNAALAQDKFDPKTIYMGSQFVHKSTDKGASWTIISPDLTTNDSKKIDQKNNGGQLNIDITGAENHCTILCIEPSAKDRNVLWVSTDDGLVQLTTDGGKTWKSFKGKLPGLPEGAWIPQIRASRYNAAEAFVVANDYRRGDFKPYIFRTKDYGKTWTRLVDEKKVRGYALCLIQDPTEPNLIFVGTEHGLWVSMDNGTSFQQFKNGYPSVSTYDLAIQEREADLAIATFGRALWILDDIRPLRAMAARQGKSDKALQVFPAPEAIQASKSNAPGYQWSTWGIWDADNRPGGARLSFFVDPKLVATKDTAKVKPTQLDSVMVHIYNVKNERIRTLKWPVDTGFNRRSWQLDEKDYRSAGEPKPKKNAPEKGGDNVLPGIYKVVMLWKKHSDSTTVTVKDDPRLGDRNAIKLAQRELMARLRIKTDQLNEALDKLTDAEETLQKLEATWKNSEEKQVDSLRKYTKTMRDKIKKLRETVNGKTEERQGYGRPLEVTTMGLIRELSFSTTGKNTAPGTTHENLLKIVSQRIDSTVAALNTFMTTDWKKFRSYVEANLVKVFKD